MLRIMRGMMLTGSVGPQVDSSPWWSAWASASRCSTSHETGGGHGHALPNLRGRAAVSTPCRFPLTSAEPVIDPGPEGHPASALVPGPPLISAEAAARALQECFLANADRGDNAANDELVAELLRRMRALRASREGGC